MKPVRVQRRRARGWTMPANTVYVGRPTKWGNPFIVGKDGTAQECFTLYLHLAAGRLCISMPLEAVQRQRAALAAMQRASAELRGKNLACWCRPGAPCHADVLLLIANKGRGKR